MQSPIITKTSRLYLREFMPDDAPHFFALNNDPEVIRYTGDAPFANEAAARAFLEAYDAYARHGMGRWAVIRKEDEAYLGWCGLKYSPDLDEVDIGFRFFRKYWGRGYATEAAQACLAYGLETLGLKEIVGRAMKANHASMRVLEKLGMQFWKEIDFDGEEGVKTVRCAHCQRRDRSTRRLLSLSDCSLCSLSDQGMSLCLLSESESSSGLTVRGLSPERSRSEPKGRAVSQ